jgi:NhaP-type Na+/H+ or K+/H+ antiporter
MNPQPDSIVLMITFAAGIPGGAVIGYLIAAYRRAADIRAAEKRTWKEASTFFDLKARHQ